MIKKSSIWTSSSTPRQWYLLVDSVVSESIGYSPISAEPWLYKNGSTLILFYVDDMLFGFSSEEHMQLIHSELEKKFKIKKIGIPKSVLGIRINFFEKPGRTILTLDNSSKILKLAEEYKMANVKFDNSIVPNNPYVKLSDKICFYHQRTD
jgi:hypothetical protein